MKIAHTLALAVFSCAHVAPDLAAQAAAFAAAGVDAAARADVKTAVLDTADADPGAALYMQRCAACHDHPRDRIPPRSTLAVLLSPEEAYKALSTGIMKQQATGLTAAEMRALALWVTGKKFGTAPPEPDVTANRCTVDGRIRLDSTQWNGWGHDYSNSRYQPHPELPAADVPRLKLKWVFALPGRGVYAQPIVVGDYLYIAGLGGWVFALNAHTGCTYWAMDAGARVRSAITIAPMAGAPGHFAAYFNNEMGAVYALDAMTGAILWTTRIDDHPLARAVGSLRVYRDHLYVPLSSIEEVTAADPKYPCCSFRGELVALDAKSGAVLWRTHSIERAPTPTRVNSSGTQMYGPAGGALWGSPTFDLKRSLIYTGTGDSYTDVPADGTDALIAFDLGTGKRRWVTQLVPNDAWIVGCEDRLSGNCPDPLGPDHDFSAAPILHTLPDGRQIIVGAAKSGVAYGFDPQNQGKILWQRKIARGGQQGGVLWGPAADVDNMYVAVSDYDPSDPTQGGGLFALKITTGEIVWQTAAPPVLCPPRLPFCSPAQLAAVTAMPGIVFSGALNGHIRAYEAKGGTIVWDFDTRQTFDAVNDAKAYGGSIDSGGQSIVDGRLYVMSGSVRLPGNALLMFTVDGK